MQDMGSFTIREVNYVNGLGKVAQIMDGEGRREDGKREER